MRAIQLAVLTLLLSPAVPCAAGEDEMFRCGRWVVSRELSPAEVLQKCGEPTSREIQNKEVYVPLANGRGTRKITLQVEKWHYDRGNSAAAMVVTIFEDRIEEMRREQ